MNNTHRSWSKLLHSDGAKVCLNGEWVTWLSCFRSLCFRKKGWVLLPPRGQCFPYQEKLPRAVRKDNRSMASHLLLLSACWGIFRFLNFCLIRKRASICWFIPKILRTTGVWASSNLRTWNSVGMTKGLGHHLVPCRVHTRWSKFSAMGCRCHKWCLKFSRCLPQVWDFWKGVHKLVGWL